MRYERANINQRTDGRATRRNLQSLLFYGAFLGIALAVTGAHASASERAIPENAVAFDLEEVATPDVPESVRSRLIVGAYTQCAAEPDQNIKRYPVLKSDKPFYGSLQVGETTTDVQTGNYYAFAVDESAGSGQGYDRLYLDLNLNGDLTDDELCQPMKDVPRKALMPIGSGITQVCFAPVMLRVTPKDGPRHEIEVMPRFLAYPDGPQYLMLMATKARQGRIEIGDRKFTVVLGHSGGIPGGFDHPSTGCYLLQSAGARSSSWYGGDRLMALQRSGDTYYRLSATPSGDKLFVWPFQGAFGVLQIKAGERDVARVTVTGSVGSKDIALSLTEGMGGQEVSTSDSYRLPVGDYSPLLLNVTYDRLNCMILRNNHADGLPRGRAQAGPPVYAIKIREDKPFVLDFSSKPQVLFASPGKNYRIQAGDELQVKAVLVDPVLDIMFRSVREGEQLNPKVRITRADGRLVAEGTMPFG